MVAGEAAGYRLLAFISLKMELHGKSNPVGKIRANLPFYKNFTDILPVSKDFKEFRSSAG